MVAKFQLRARMSGAIFHSTSDTFSRISWRMKVIIAARSSWPPASLAILCPPASLAASGNGQNGRKKHECELHHRPIRKGPEIREYLRRLGRIHHPLREEDADHSI